MTEAVNTIANQQSTKRNAVATRMQERLRGWSESGRSKSAYCKREGVNYQQMIYWSRKLSPTTSGNPVTHNLRSQSPMSSGFVAVSVNPSTSPAGLYLRLPNGIETHGVEEHRVGKHLMDSRWHKKYVLVETMVWSVMQAQRSDFPLA